MRKNKINRKNLSFFTEYKVKGLNSDNLVNILKNKGIILTDVKKKDNKTLFISINYADNEKFFAITRDLCYNIKKVGEKGKLRFFAGICRNFGLIVGACVFFSFCSVSDNYLFNIEYRGSGSIYSREVSEYLSNQGIGKYSKFSDINLPKLSDSIMSVSDNISFAECTKNGNRLIIDLALSTVPPNVLKTDKENILSDVDGEIEYIKVYRGTALKSVGDKVTKGEVVCDGYATVKDTTVKVGVIATVGIKAEYNYTYTSKNDNEEDLAVIFAEITFGDGDITNTIVEKNRLKNGSYEYKVKIFYRKTLH